MKILISLLVGLISITLLPLIVSSVRAETGTSDFTQDSPAKVQAVTLAPEEIVQASVERVSN